MFTVNLGDGLACLDFVQDLLLEVFGKDASLNACGRWSLFRSIPP